MGKDDISKTITVFRQTLGLFEQDKALCERDRKVVRVGTYVMLGGLLGGAALTGGVANIPLLVGSVGMLAAAFLREDSQRIKFPMKVQEVWAKEMDGALITACAHGDVDTLDDILALGRCAGKLAGIRVPSAEVLSNALKIAARHSPEATQRLLDLPRNDDRLCRVLASPKLVMLAIGRVNRYRNSTHPGHEQEAAQALKILKTIVGRVNEVGNRHILAQYLGYRDEMLDKLATSTQDAELMRHVKDMRMNLISMNVAKRRNSRTIRPIIG